MKRLNITAEMADGRTLTGSTNLADYLRWEATAKARGWPAAGPTWEAFLAYAVLTRTGQYIGKWEAFQTDCEMPDAQLPAPAPDADPDTAGDVEPTSSGLTPDS